MKLLAGTVAVMAALAIPLTSANAGGAHLQWDDEFAIPGDIVRGYALVELGPTTGRQGSLEEGPYYAYLSQKDWGAPPLPSGSTRLAPIEIDPLPGGKVAEVTVEFVAPAVDPGYYWIINCNDPCRGRFGDLVAGQINVVADKSEARVLDLSFRISEDVYALEQRLRRKVLDRNRDSISSRLVGLAKRVDQLEAKQRKDRGPNQARKRAASGAPVGAMLIASAAAALISVILRRYPKHPVEREV